MCILSYNHITPYNAKGSAIRFLEFGIKMTSVTVSEAQGSVQELLFRREPQEIPWMER